VINVIIRAEHRPSLHPAQAICPLPLWWWSTPNNSLPIHAQTFAVALWSLINAWTPSCITHLPTGTCTNKLVGEYCTCKQKTLEHICTLLHLQTRICMQLTHVMRALTLAATQLWLQEPGDVPRVAGPWVRPCCLRTHAVNGNKF